MAPCCVQTEAQMPFLGTRSPSELPTISTALIVLFSLWTNQFLYPLGDKPKTLMFLVLCICCFGALCSSPFSCELSPSVKAHANGPLSTKPSLSLWKNWLHLCLWRAFQVSDPFYLCSHWGERGLTCPEIGHWVASLGTEDKECQHLCLP